VSTRRIDLPTLVAVAIVAYALSNVAHEGLAHGGACVAAGGEPRMLNAVFFDCGRDGVSDAGSRWIAAAGSLVNLVLAALSVVLLRRARRPHAVYFLWLFATINAVQATGYWLFSGVAGIGDWAVVVGGWQPAWAWRTLLAICGGAGYWAVVVASLRRLAPLVGPGDDRVALAVRLTVVPYVVGGLLYVGAGLLNPEGVVLVLISGAAASLGGTSALAWMAQLLNDPRRARPATEPPFALHRSFPWIGAGALVAALFVGLLGPGLEL